jgi:hypothetical protein
LCSKKIINKKAICQQQFAKMAGFGLNLKMVLYLQSQCLTESLGFLNPPLLQAAKRYEQVSEKSAKYENIIFFVTSIFLFFSRR